jgi:cytochrome P450
MNPDDGTSTVYPTVRHQPLDPPGEFAIIRSASPLCRMTYPDGHVGWLVTGHGLARQLLADPRMSARSEFKRPPVGRDGIEPFYGKPALPGWLVDMDPPQHTRIRQNLMRYFTVNRMHQLERLVLEAADDLMAACADSAGAVDLVSAFCMPLATYMISEVLGIPDRYRPEFGHNVEVLFSLSESAESAQTAMTVLSDLLGAIVQGPGAELGGVLESLKSAGDLANEEIAGVGVLLLTAAQDSVTSSLSLSIATMIVHPRQRRMLVDDPQLVRTAVEELLRYLTIFHHGVPRTPLEDVEYEGQLIRAGESITVSLPAANRDPGKFGPDADDFRIERNSSGHLAFGHGIHQCVGQNLVRTVMKVAVPALLGRFPELRLATPLSQVPFSHDMSIYGAHRLPVLLHPAATSEAA